MAKNINHVKRLLNACPIKTRRILLRLISGLVDHPDDEHLRFIKSTTNAFVNHIEPVCEALEALHLFGFEPVEDGLRIQHIDLELSKIYLELLQGNATSHVVNVPVSNAEKQLYDPRELRKLISHENFIREHGGSADPVPLNYVYHPPTTVINHVKWEETSQRMMLTKDEISKLKAVFLGDIPFSSKARAELDRLKKIPVYAAASIKVVAPDSSYITFTMKPNTLVADMMNLISTRFISHEVNIDRMKLRYPRGVTPNPTSTLYHAVSKIYSLCQTLFSGARSEYPN